MTTIILVVSDGVHAVLEASESKQTSTIAFAWFMMVNLSKSCIYNPTSIVFLAEFSY